MRVENWHPDLASNEITKKAMNRLQKGGELVASKARQKVPIGKDRPPYKTGKEWTARKAGALKNSIRVVRLKDDPKLNVRIYAGNKEVYYARWVEMGSVHNKEPRKPYLRPSLHESKAAIMSIMENG
jgi:tRNA G10  N-methylase Trm11